MPRFQSIFGLFMISPTLNGQEIINDLEMFELMVFQTTNVRRTAPESSDITVCGTGYPPWLPWVPWRYMAERPEAAISQTNNS